MVKQYSTDKLDSVFQALSHRARRKMLLQLKDGVCTAHELAEPHSMSLPAVSKHLKVLEKACLVKRVIQGRQHFFTLEPKSLNQTLRWTQEFKGFWNSNLENF